MTDRPMLDRGAGTRPLTQGTRDSIINVWTNCIRMILMHQHLANTFHLGEAQNTSRTMASVKTLGAIRVIFEN